MAISSCSATSSAASPSRPHHRHTPRPHHRHTPRPHPRHTRALPRVSRRVQHHRCFPPPPLAVIPAPCRGYLAECSTIVASRRLPLPSYPRPAAGISPSTAPKPHLTPPPSPPGSVAPNLIWGPSGGRQRHGAPSRPANGRQRQLGPPALRTALGIGPKSSLRRRKRTWCRTHQDTRGKRGYDGSKHRHDRSANAP